MRLNFNGMIGESAQSVCGFFVSLAYPQGLRSTLHIESPKMLSQARVTLIVGKKKFQKICVVK
jgi:hypothetical protein